MVGLVALGGTRLVHGSLVSHNTDPATYAVVGTLIGLAMTLSLFLPSGLGNAASRYISFHIGRGDPDAARTAYRVLTAAGYACAALLAGLAALIAVRLPGVTTGDAIAVAVLAAVYSGYSVAKGSLYGFDRIVPDTWLEVVGSVVAIGGTVGVIAAGVHSYLVPLAVGYSVLMLGSFAVLWRRRPRDRAPKAGGGTKARIGLRELAGWVALASLGVGASAGLLQVLPVLAGRSTTRVEVAYLVAAVTLVQPLSFLPRALSLALFPAMARAHGAGDIDVVRRQVDVSTRALLALLAPLFAAATLVAPEVLAVFGGGEYADGAAVLRLLLLASFVGSIQVGAVNSLSSGDSLRIPVYAAVAGAVVGVAVLIPLGHWLGAVGIGIAYLVAVAVTTAVPLRAVWRRYGKAWAGPLLRSVMVVAAALAVAWGLEATRPYGSSRVVVELLAAFVVVALAAAVLRRDIARVLAARHG